jgi:hypothetical protein
MRADARLNRERILSVAYEAFADDPDVSLNTNRQAGRCRGRHPVSPFPDP